MKGALLEMRAKEGTVGLSLYGDAIKRSMDSGCRREVKCGSGEMGNDEHNRIQYEKQCYSMERNVESEIINADGAEDEAK